MTTTIRTLRYHGPGFEVASDDWELLIWQPRPKPARPYWAISFRAQRFDTGEYDDEGEPCTDFRVDEFERFPTAADLFEFVEERVPTRAAQLIGHRLDHGPQA